MDNLVGKIDSVIKASSKSPLGVISLCIFMLSLLAYFLFRDESGNEKTVIFIFISMSFLLFVWVMYSKMNRVGAISDNSSRQSLSTVVEDNNESQGVRYSFQSKLIEQFTKEYEANKKGVLDLNYQASMNWERVFLKRVSALYDGVETVHAVTLSSISDFWISGQDEVLIQEYLECQINKKIKRLFVFESPYDLKVYENILKLNYEAYGKSGGAVLVTSARFYQSTVLHKIAPKQSKFRLLNLDFGIWGSEVEILAELKGTDLKFRMIPDYSELESEIYIEKFKSILDSPLDGIITWNDVSESEEVAKNIFMEDVTYVGPVIHLVLMKHENRELLESIASSIKRLDEIQREAIRDDIPLNFCQEEPWWGINLNELDDRQAFTDGKWGGRLETCDEYAYMLKIDLPSIDDLKAWYAWGPHSEIRRDIYSSLHHEVVTIYELLDKAEAKFDEVEHKIKESGYLKRMDFIYNKKLDAIEPFLNFDDSKEIIRKKIASSV